MTTRQECVCDNCGGVGELEGSLRPQGWLSVLGPQGIIVDGCSTACAHALVDARFGRLVFVSKLPLVDARRPV